MAFQLPPYHPPRFEQPPLSEAPLVSFGQVEQDGVAPTGYHATSIFPEYLHLAEGHWQILRNSRMDCVVVRQEDGSLVVKEFRRLKKGEPVALGRGENGEQGIYVDDQAFGRDAGEVDKFAFRTRVTRETSFSIDYDQLYSLLEFERQHGFIVWVLGPAVAFDADSRRAMARLIQAGYVHALLAGNALAAHDVEAALHNTALGQEIYCKRHVPLGHYHHLDAINRIKSLGSLQEAMKRGIVKDGIMRAALQKDIPIVLAGSIRDDGPLPEVIADVYEAQDAMRAQLRQATTVLSLATQLHSIATGNMVPSYQVGSEGAVRPVYFYTVDISEFAANKLADRGSLSAKTIITNVQDFVVNVARCVAGAKG
jgi:lysine-ketoglutarate reductase/saccharopine dehydrogenase-like protein (TIGR00300 family)